LEAEDQLGRIGGLKKQGPQLLLSENKPLQSPKGGTAAGEKFSLRSGFRQDAGPQERVKKREATQLLPFSVIG